MIIFRELRTDPPRLIGAGKRNTIPLCSRNKYPAAINLYGTLAALEYLTQAEVPVLES
jgi:hypothetical protein